MNKKISFLGLGTYTVLLILSIVFFKERAAFVDIAFHIFYIIKDNDFAIQNHRFIAFFTQLFPLFSSKMGLSLSNIMKLYSSSFIVLNVIIFAFLSYILRLWKFALILILMNTIMVSHTFYWIQSELQQGLSLLILYFGLAYYLLNSKCTDFQKYSIFSFLQVLLFALVFSHPMLLFAFAFITIYFMLSESKRYLFWGSGLISFVLMYGIKLFFFKTAYDSSTSLSGITNLKNSLPHFFDLPSNTLFVQYCIHDYHFLILFFLLVCGFYLYRKSLIRLSLVVMFFLGYIILINASYPNGADQFYIENLYLPLSIFILFPLVFEVLDFVNPKYLVPMICILLLIRISNIYANHEIYTNRIATLEEIIENNALQSDKKIITAETKPLIDKLLMTWGTPYEIWLLSTLKSGEGSSIVISDNVKELEWVLPYNKKFVTKWGVFDYSELPRQYFIFNDTTYYHIK